MNEFEEKMYRKIRNELVQSTIDKKIDTYVTNRNELMHYYNVGKMIIDAQGGEEKAKYGDNLIKRYSERLTKEIGKGYSTRNLKYMRKFYLFQKGLALPTQFKNDASQKGHPVGAQFINQISWSHYRELLRFDDTNEINYYIMQAQLYHWGKRTLQEHIKNKEYQRLPTETKNKLINKEKLNVYDGIKNPILINTYDNFKEDVSEKALKTFILKDLNNFLKQLGDGFCYIEDEYKIQIGNASNYIDILLFNYIYNCFVIVELKVTNSRKDHFGQIMVYMNYIDKHIRRINQDKTIGIIVCKKDDKYLIEYSSDPRIKITTYKLV